MARKRSTTPRWPPAPSLRKLTPEERVNMAIEMSSSMGELVLDSIRDQNPGISERELLNKAHKRIYGGRRAVDDAVVRRVFRQRKTSNR